MKELDRVKHDVNKVHQRRWRRWIEY